MINFYKEVFFLERRVGNHTVGSNEYDQNHIWPVISSTDRGNAHLPSRQMTSYCAKVQRLI